MTRLVFGVDVPSVEVCVDPPPAAARVAGLFEPYLRAHDGVRAPTQVEILWGPGGGAVRAGEQVFEAVSVPDLLARAEFEIARGLLASLGDYAQLHAAGTVVDGAAVLAVGPSGAGKSSLALAWHGLGHTLLGDDAVLVDASGHARCFARLLKLDVERAVAMGVRVEGTPAYDPGAAEVWVDPSEGAGWAWEPAVVRTLAFVRREEGSPLAVRALRPAEALRRLLDQLLGHGLEPALALERLARLAETARCVEVVFDRADRAAAALAGPSIGDPGA